MTLIVKWYDTECIMIWYNWVWNHMTLSVKWYYPKCGIIWPRVWNDMTLSVKLYDPLCEMILPLFMWYDPECKMIWPWGWYDLEYEMIFGISVCLIYSLYHNSVMVIKLFTSFKLIHIISHFLLILKSLLTN